MPLSVDYSTDGELVDGYELVTYTPKNATNTTPICDLMAVRTSVLQGENGPSPGSYTTEPSLVVFFVWSSGLGTAIPDPGDWITDSDEVIWTVFSATKRADGAQWRLTCRKAY